MKKGSIQNSENILKEVKGLYIKSCLRLFFDIDVVDIPDALKEQEADGNVYFILSNSEIIGFYPYTEKCTLKFEFLDKNNLPEGLLDISANQYWRGKIGQKIVDLELLYNQIDTPYGIRFYLENRQNVELQYISESEYTFDALIIK